MKTSTGKFDAASRTIEVTFTEGRIVHKRTINAVTDAKGQYDAQATKEIIDAQAAGVAHKIKLGLIR